MTEHQTSRLLREATDDLPSDVDALVRGGTSRGRALRRRRRTGTALAAAAVVGVVGVATTGAVGGAADDAGPGLAGDPSAETAPPGVEPAPLGVAAADVPALVARLLPEVEVGPLRRGPAYPLVDEPDRRVAHFSVAGTLTSVAIERLDAVPDCPVQDAGSDDATCSTVDGVEVLTTGPTTADGVTAQSVAVWLMGWVVSVRSYDAAEGKDAPVVTPGPALSIAQLTTLATSLEWYVVAGDPGYVNGS